MSDLRPIAPFLKALSDTHMPRAHAQNDLYAASCNPPRQAKRLRSHSIQTDVDQITFSLAPPPFKAAPISKSPSKMVHAQPSVTSSSGPMKTTPDSPSSKRRGRKPSTSSRATREAQRKMNHSIIEKARRTKINNALSTLRTLVPLQHKRSQDEDDDDDYEEGEKGKKGEDKEFKLDVLVRTVTFLQELTEKVKTLEQGVCSTCSGKMSSKGKKRRRAETEELDVEGPEPTCHHEIERHTDPPNTVHDEHSSSSRTRLPSIASWLPQASIDPTHLPHSPLLISSSTRDNQQLPSPPSSTDFRPLITTRIPPTLTLPSPKSLGSISALPSVSQPPISSASPTIYPGSAKTSPLLSPVRTAEDESAASVLLHISSSSYGSSSSSERSYAGDREPERSEPMKPLTPSSMLGLQKRR